MKKIRLSVRIITYNHERYIAQALDSILMQKTDFPFEICLGEDDSSDGTREICKRYAEKYPEKIRLFLRSRNDVIYIKGRPSGRFNFLETLKACRGEFMAFLDGDDYWTDPEKLQRQVDYLDAHPECVGCFHWTMLSPEAGDSNPVNHIKIGPLSIKNQYDMDDLLEQGMFIHSSSSVVRSKYCVSLPPWIRSVEALDFPLHIILAENGYFGCIDECMSVYRLQPGGGYAKLSRTGQLKLRKRIYCSMGREMYLSRRRSFKRGLRLVKAALFFEYLLMLFPKPLRRRIAAYMDVSRRRKIRKIYIRLYGIISGMKKRHECV